MKYLLLIILIVASCFNMIGMTPIDHSNKKDAKIYFPPNTLNNSFIEEWYSRQLSAMKEPILINDTSTDEVYRFTWLRTFDNPITIRIERNNDSYSISWKQCDGDGGYHPGELIVDNKLKLEKQSWELFLIKLNKIDFWNLPTIKNNELGLDGSQWILEGRSGNIYHVVDRWTPRKESQYYQCCDLLISLTELEIDNERKY